MGETMSNQSRWCLSASEVEDSGFHSSMSSSYGYHEPPAKMPRLEDDVNFLQSFIREVSELSQQPPAGNGSGITATVAASSNAPPAFTFEDSTNYSIRSELLRETPMAKFSGAYQARSADGKHELKILTQPEDQHRLVYKLYLNAIAVKGSSISKPLAKAYKTHTLKERTHAKRHDAKKVTPKARFSLFHVS